jgi:hypothetical protein
VLVCWLLSLAQQAFSFPVATWRCTVPDEATSSGRKPGHPCPYRETENRSTAVWRWCVCLRGRRAAQDCARYEILILIVSPAISVLGSRTNLSAATVTATLCKSLKSIIAKLTKNFPPFAVPEDSSQWLQDTAIFTCLSYVNQVQTLTFCSVRSILILFSLFKFLQYSSNFVISLS